MWPDGSTESGFEGGESRPEPLTQVCSSDVPTGRGPPKHPRRVAMCGRLIVLIAGCQRAKGFVEGWREFQRHT